MNGDDRSAFLKHNPYDLLYWWHIMDKYNLLFFTFARMDDDNSASSGKTVGSVARKKARTDGKSDSGPGKHTNRQLELQQEMTTNVADIGQSMEQVAFANLQVVFANLSGQCEALKQKKIDLEFKKLEYAGNIATERLIDSRIGDLDITIKTIQERLSMRHNTPRRIDFNEPQSSVQSSVTQLAPPSARSQESPSPPCHPFSSTPNDSNLC